ncbi:hypothetical protein BDV26DRAFT_214549 [Aspergillus bertholletiae]|uniref:Uncharacterized protein n=1 Tax=Aspergillus bertholletiae TaxID=1226010 RepID=A0A5N7B5M2_9EURO|nr:hypothetical protein BDV26DRAFT_214549 [Aspergillus bertholletiae]
MTSTYLSFVSDWIASFSCINYAVVCNKSSGYPCLVSAMIAAHADSVVVGLGPEWSWTADNALSRDSTRCWSQPFSFLFSFFFTFPFVLLCLSYVCAVMGHRLMQCTIIGHIYRVKRDNRQEEEPV